MMPFWVLISATRTLLSFPTKTFVMRPKRHSVAGRKSSLMTTKSFSFRLFRVVFHLYRRWSSVTYSDFQRLLKRCWIAFKRFQRCSWDKSPLGGLLGASGGAVIGAPLKKWPGVNGSSSDGFCDNGHRGMEFRIASILVSMVLNSSNVNDKFFVIFFKWDFMLFTAASHRPPMCGAWGGMNDHDNPWMLYFSDRHFSAFARKRLCSCNNLRLAPRNFDHYLRTSSLANLYVL